MLLLFGSFVVIWFVESEVPRAFGTTSYGTYSASGFVVDKEQGIILTNKHVVTSGPIRAKARFLRNEEIDLSK